MRKRVILLAVLLVFLFFIPEGIGNRIRNKVVGSIAPKPSAVSNSSIQQQQVREELESQIYKNQLCRLADWMQRQNQLQRDAYTLGILQEQENPFFKTKATYLAEIIAKQLYAVPAQVIWREPSNWSSHLWVNVGLRDNEKLGKNVIVEDSPVVVGKVIVGVVEEVCETRSRIRLITDQKICPSVRVLRGNDKNRVLREKISDLNLLLSTRGDMEGADELQNQLDVFQKTLSSEKESTFSIRGELKGASLPLWRVQRQVLRGVGFYSTSLDEGKWDLDQNRIACGDLLVTTGMDGIFPPDFHVAYVTKVFPLREGDVTYQIEACSMAGNLSDLREVYILPR